MQGDQRGGAGRVDGERGALQAEGVGDPPGGHAARAAVAEVGLQLLGDVVEHPARVVVVHDAGEDAGPAAAHRGRVDPGPLERLPGDLQQQPLLRVDGQRLLGADAEEARVELVGVVEESALAGVGLAGAFRVGVVERVDVPAAVLGEAGDCVGAGPDQVPQVFLGLHAAGVPAADADDRDRLLGVDESGRRRAAGLVRGS